MKAEDGLVNHGRERQVVKELGELAPHVGIAVLPEALVVEAVDLRDLARLVVASQNSDAVRVAHF